jgi:hypothetical protein
MMLSYYFDSNCLGNLDIQYITGMAQHTTSIYWYVSGDGDDPFVSWITDVANEKNPPKSNSISFGTVEQVSMTSLPLTVLVGVSN